MDKRSCIALLALLVQMGCAQLSSEEEDFSTGCFEAGLNPHPKDCWKYLICKENGFGKLIADQYSCPEYEVYSHSEQRCVPESKSINCEREGPTSDPECGGRLLNCKDCNSLAICALEGDGTYHMIGNVTCSGTKKYCDNEKLECTNVQPIQCVPHAPCTSADIFPSISNCSIFYTCTAQGSQLVDTVGVCEKGHVFDPFFKDPLNPCRHRDSPEYCITVKCNGVLEYKEYSKGSPYYVLCTPTGNYVYSCGKGNIYHQGGNPICEIKQLTTTTTTTTTVKAPLPPSKGAGSST